MQKKFLLLALLIVSVLIFFRLFSDNDINAIVENVYTESIVKEYDDHIYSVRYPVIEVRGVDKIIENETQMHLDAFLEAQSSSKDTDAMDELNVSFEIKHFSQNVYSVVLIKTVIIDGKKEQSQESFQFNLQKDKLLDNGNIFRWGYTKDIAELTKEKLTHIKKSTFSKQEIEALTTFSKDNFPSYYFTEKGITFLLTDTTKDKVQGTPIEVFLSYKELEGVLKKQYATDQKNLLTLDEQEEQVSLQEEKVVTPMPTANKQITLTFDDGPNARVTPQVLDTLKKYHVKATFFVLGSNAELSPELIKRMFDEGHTIGNHTYIHRNLSTLSEKDILIELNKTDTVIKEITKETTHYLRPPYGSYNDKVVKVAKKEIVMWNIDPEDWKYQDMQIVANNVITQAKDGGVILLHDIYQSSADALDIIIPTLQKQGYEFVPISEIDL